MTLEEMAKEAGYNGCRNCKHQIEPLRMCEWAEAGGDGKIHLVCPHWQLKGSEDPHYIVKMVTMDEIKCDNCKYNDNNSLYVAECSTCTDKDHFQKKEGEEE